MAVRIRMKRFGRKNRPYFRIVATDHHSPRDGATIETLGHYDPIEKDETKVLDLNEERVRYWLSVGAQPSETVASILAGRKIQIPWKVRRLEKQRAVTLAKKEKKGTKGKPRASKPPVPLSEKAKAEAGRAAAEKVASTKKMSKKEKKQIDKAK
jgi:small subunit ribosomal protein S16